MGMVFSVEQTRVIMNGHTFTGFSDDAEDAIMFTEFDLATVRESPGDLPAYTSTGRIGGQLTLKLIASSRSHAFLQQQVAQIMRGASVIWDGIIVDRINNHTITLEKGVLLTPAIGTSVGRDGVANRNYVFHIGRIVLNYDAYRNLLSPITDALGRVGSVSI